jgi:hypothetical protein
MTQSDTVSTSTRQRRARLERQRLGLPLHSRGRPPVECVPFAEDPIAMELVARNPDGLTLDQVGTYLGLTRERVRQVQEIALAKIEAALTADGLDAMDFARWLSRARIESEPDSTAPRSEPWVSSCEARDKPLAVEPYSEHGQRVEAAIRELEAAAERAKARRDVARVVEGMEL